MVLGRNLIEYTGWRTRGSEIFSPKGSVNHHTAGPRLGVLPSLNTLVYGRSDLPGPLCNAALDRNNNSRSPRIHLIAAGKANHAGLGGWKGLSGNSSVWGLEVEHSGTSAEPVTQEQWDMMYRWHAACCDVSGVKADFVCQHFEWAPTRKIDFVKTITNVTTFRGKVATLLNPPEPTPEPKPPEDDDVPKPLLVRLNPKDPAVLYMSSARTVHWVKGTEALQGYKLDMQNNGLSPDVCVLSAVDEAGGLEELHDFVVNLPFIGEWPYVVVSGVKKSTGTKEAWKGAHIPSEP